MSSALKPVLTSGPQTSSVTNQVNKPMHSQGTPNTFGQPTSHVPENLVSSTHSNTSHNFANSQANHYSINVPNASEHYTSNTSSVTVSGHPLPISTQASIGNQAYISTKSVPFPPGYQSSHTHQPNQTFLTPIVQNLPATQISPSHAHNPADESQERQSNGNDSPAESKDNCLATNEDSVVPLAKIHSPESVKLDLSEKTPDAINKNETSQSSSLNSEAKSGQTPEVDNKAAPCQELGKLPAVSSSTNSECINKEDPTVSTSGKQKPFTTQSVTAPLKSDESHSEVKSQDESKAEVDSSVTSLDTEKQVEGEQEHNNEKDTISSSSSDNETAIADVTPVLGKPLDQAAEQTKVQSIAKSSTVLKTPARRSKTRTDVESTKKQVTPVLKTPQGKSTRIRTRTQPYQSPLPEIEIITKISSAPRTPKSNDDKLIVFYKNEFLAVRNSEGGFYVCQAVQNIYKSSQKKLKIRWLSQDKDEKSGEIYTPDFYDQTDFDCILTNLNLERIDKGKYRLPAAEKERTDSILNRSLAAEKGEVEPPSLTEEHPDGLDLSLYKDEGQLKKRGTKRKASTLSPKKAAVQKPLNKSKVQKVDKASKKSTENVLKVIKKQHVEPKKSTANASRNDRAKRRNDTQSKSKNSSTVDQKKAKVLAKVVKKSTMSSISAANRNHTNAKNSKTLKAAVTLKVAAKTSKALVKPTKRSSRK